MKTITRLGYSIVPPSLTNYNPGSAALNSLPNSEIQPSLNLTHLTPANTMNPADI